VPRRGMDERLAGCYDQGIDRAPVHSVACPQRRRDQGDRLIDTPQTLQVHLQRVGKDGIEYVVADLGQGRMRWDITGARERPRNLADADDEYAIGAQMKRRADRRQLLHGAVAEVHIADPLRRVNERNRRRAE